MKSYIAELLDMINQRVVQNETNLLRVEGVENPYIYLAIYDTLKQKYGSKLIAYIAPEKVAIFEKEEGNQYALRFQNN